MNKVLFIILLNFRCFLIFKSEFHIYAHGNNNRYHFFSEVGEMKIIYSLLVVWFLGGSLLIKVEGEALYVPRLPYNSVDGSDDSKEELRQVKTVLFSH